MAVIMLGKHAVGPDQAPFIIAELSGNHDQSLDKALLMVEAAAKCGADAIKLQTYTPDTITLNLHQNEFFIDNPDSLWHGSSLYSLYQQAMTPWEWHKPLFDYARKIGITIFSSPFDNTAVDLLEDLNAPAFKIASFEAVDLPLIRYAASTGKPMIISTGMADAEEIREAIQFRAEIGAGVEAAGQKPVHPIQHCGEDDQPHRNLEPLHHRIAHGGEA